MSSEYNDDIQIRFIAVEDCQRVFDFVKLYFFTNEPLSTCHKPGEERGFGESIIRSFLESGLCLMAICQATNELVGITLNSAEHPKKTEELRKDIPKRDDATGVKIHKFLTSVEYEADLFKRYNVDKILHLVILCVKSEMRGRSIGKRLFEAVWNLGKQQSFELVAVDCTSFYSARIAEHLGWDCVNVCYYRDYVDEDNNQVFNPLPPHECCKIYAVRLL